MLNKPKKNLPIKPAIVDGLTRFINLPELQRKARRKNKSKTKKKDLHSLNSALLFSFLTLFTLIYWITPFKTNKIVMEDQRPGKKVSNAHDQFKVPMPALKSFAMPTLSSLPKQDDAISSRTDNPVDTSYIAHENINYDTNHELYEGTNSDSIDEPNMEDIGRYIANEEEIYNQENEDESSLHKK